MIKASDVLISVVVEGEWITVFGPVKAEFIFL